MIGRRVARLLVTMALLCASVAWTGWVVLQTVGDPSRSSRIAHAVLDDPAARDQIAADLASGLADAANSAAAAAAAGTNVRVPKIDGDDPSLRAAVAAALADTRVTGNLTDALAAEHANLLGVEPKQPAMIDTALLVEVVSRALCAANPGLAAQLTSAAPKAVALPDVEIPFAAPTRRFATTAVPRLALVAVALVGVALLVGERPRVLRRVGAWGIGAGLMWVLVPRGLVWMSERWAPANAAVVRAVLHGATGVVTAMATLLLVGGASAFAAGVVFGRVAALQRGVREAARARDRARDAAAPVAVRDTVVEPRRDPRDADRERTPAEPRALAPGWRAFTGRDLPRGGVQPAPTRFDGRA